MTHETPAHKIAEFMERRSGWLVLAVVAATALLVIPMVALAPEETASDNPGGLVYELEDKVNSQLPPRFHGTFYLVEARDGDMLTQAPLWELYQNIEKLRQVDAEGKLNPDDLEEQPYLFSWVRRRPTTAGGRGIHRRRRGAGGAGRDGDQPGERLGRSGQAGVELRPDRGRRRCRTSYTEDKSSRGSKCWASRSTTGGRLPWACSWPRTTLSSAGAHRVSARPVTRSPEARSSSAGRCRAVLRGDEQSYQLWGVAIDAGLEIEDEVGTAVPFIVATFVVVLIVVGISLRSWRSVLLTAIGLAMMIVWLKGLSNLVGLKSSTVLDFIVPIAMISLGADFVIHAVNRYREERRIGLAPRPAFRLGMAGVLGALALAMVTDDHGVPVSTCRRTSRR